MKPKGTGWTDGAGPDILAFTEFTEFTAFPKEDLASHSALTTPRSGSTGTSAGQPTLWASFSIAPPPSDSSAQSRRAAATNWPTAAATSPRRPKLLPPHSD